MANTVTTLDNIFEPQPGRLITVVKILAQNSTEEFTVSDLTGEAKLVVREHKSTQSKYLQPGSTVKIVSPELNQASNSLIIGRKTHVFPAMPFQNLVAREVHLSDIKDFDGKKIVRASIALKIVKVDVTNQKTIYGSSVVKRCIVKDVKGDKTKLSSWQRNRHFQSLTENATLNFTNLMVETFPLEKPHFLAVTDVTKVSNNVNLQIHLVPLPSQISNLILSLTG